MKIKSMLVILVVFFICFAPLHSARSQKPSDVNLEKLDGRFRQLLQKAKGWDIRGLAPMDKQLKKVKDGKEVYGAIIYAQDIKALRRGGIDVQSEQQTFATALVDDNDLIKLARMDGVTWVDAGALDTLHNDVARIASGVDLANNGFFNNTEYKGQDVLICIVDTGIDWEHLDFRDPTDPTQSRILAIWDQTISPQGSESNPADFTYGVEYTQAQINDELDGSPAGFVRSQDTHGHGTHVAGTAAGNGAASVDGSKFAGMAPKADILVVKAGNGSFPTTNIIDALTWADDKADDLGMPLIVNMSLGSNSGPHDGTDSKSQAIDDLVQPGRCVVVSAGNDGDDNIHVSDQINGSQYDDITVSVPSYTAMAGSNNDILIMEFWFDSNLDISATVTSPNGYSLTVGPGNQNDSNTADGTIYISNYTFSGNLDRYIYVKLYDQIQTTPPQTGSWTVRLTNQTTTTATTFHGWFADRTIGNPLTQASLSGADAAYTLGNTATEAIIVGSYVSRWRWLASNGLHYSGGGTDISDDISLFSSFGPTRYGIQDKPDIAAPGQAIVSSRSADTSPSPGSLVANDQHLKSQGTSMAAPVVAGAMALLHEINPTVDPSTLLSIVNQNAIKDNYTGAVWGEQWGNGKLNIVECINDLINPQKSIASETLVYDEWGSNFSYITLPTSDKLALKINPTLSGFLSGIWLHMGWDEVTSDIRITAYNEAAGKPANPIGESVTIPASGLLAYSWNLVNLANSHVALKQDSTYFVAVEPISASTSFGLETGTSDTRTSYFNGSDWYLQSWNLRLRPVIARDGILLVAKLFLQGGYNDASGTMNININTDLPLTSPYAEDPRTLATMPPGIVDWVLIQLTDPATNSVVASHSALLHSSGCIVADDGATGVVFLDVVPDDYRILLKHRNHVVIASASTPTMNGSNDTLFDFTDSANLYDQNGAVELQTNIWGLWCGDSDGSDLVNSTDYTVWYNAVRASASGYEAADINLDGLVDQTDYTLWQNSASAGAQAVLP
ncbi:S8 family serine peptidase [candidate division KSB1 bacterium]|nr:S8 family serine peptidase [candidate division KSB1 bacterium]